MSELMNVGASMLQADLPSKSVGSVWGLALCDNEMNSYFGYISCDYNDKPNIDIGICEWFSDLYIVLFHSINFKHTCSDYINTTICV